MFSRPRGGNSHTFVSKVLSDWPKAKACAFGKSLTMTTALPIKMSMLKSSLQQVKPLPLIPPESISFHQGSFLLGEGSFGTVKRGVWNGRAVAVKVVFQRIKKRNNRQFAGPGNLQQHKEPANDEANYQRMVQLLSNEARVMNEAQHPRIIALLGFIEQEASLVMEFMECGSLYEYIAKNGEIHWNRKLLLLNLNTIGDVI